MYDLTKEQYCILTSFDPTKVTRQPRPLYAFLTISQLFSLRWQGMRINLTFLNSALIDWECTDYALLIAVQSKQNGRNVICFNIHIGNYDESSFLFPLSTLLKLGLSYAQIENKGNF